jgi:glycosyltransferase involved in cell wall biosynthesis
MISILILTFNEEKNLPECLQSFAWSDDIVVLDSFSTDRTVEIAKAGGARVIQRHFDNWSAHQNWAMQNIAFRHPWVYTAMPMNE